MITMTQFIAASYICWSCLQECNRQCKKFFT